MAPRLALVLYGYIVGNPLGRVYAWPSSDYRLCRCRLCRFCQPHHFTLVLHSPRIASIKICPLSRLVVEYACLRELAHRKADGRTGF
ncbi:hypothetical protein GGS23DRAFT_586822 [Durotheca rogersii]|uniref:uncharacterized protein n=1 Tax=Durotheca rogersii TaxID=419775 RepID=UPI00222077F7|nr:uncharacterized protein GGS23DRAFT_586822 [Durotheca rogersii]KAI5858295.1 hypothetical protein GGS23DRAFT_586822 [Durotheca rogersii]